MTQSNSSMNDSSLFAFSLHLTAHFVFVMQGCYWYIESLGHRRNQVIFPHMLIELVTSLPAL